MSGAKELSLKRLATGALHGRLRASVHGIEFRVLGWSQYVGVFKTCILRGVYGGC